MIELENKVLDKIKSSVNNDLRIPFSIKPYIWGAVFLFSIFSIIFYYLFSII